MLGENQVLAQVKAAYTMSIDACMSRFLFHRLFHNAFRVGKAVRTRTDINCGAVSVSLAAVELAQKQLNLQAADAMLIGAGENAELAARYLVKAGLKNLIIANRSLENAAQMQARLGAGRVISLDDIQPELAHIDLLITSTAAEHPLVTFPIAEPVLKNRGKMLLIIDIAVPRDVDPDLAKFACVSLHNIDDLDRQVGQNRQKRRREIPKAQQIVAEFTDAFAKWYASLDLVPVITDLTQKGLDLARAEAKRYAADFGPDSDMKLRLFAESLVRKILHGPITFLKSVEEEPAAEQLQAVDLINKMFLSQDKTEQ
jgi:glutamyl-tRNA reductase